MTIKVPISLTVAGLFLKIIALVVILLALKQMPIINDNATIIGIELFGIGLFMAARKLQALKEWARLACWGFALFMGLYLIYSYSMVAFSPNRTISPPAGALIMGVTFLWLFGFLSQPQIKRLFRLKRHYRRK